MATTLEIVRGISQVLANSYDGALDDKGEPIKVGLRREEGHPILDSRVMDGFKVSFHGPQLCIYYHAELSLKTRILFPFPKLSIPPLKAIISTNVVFSFSKGITFPPAEPKTTTLLFRKLILTNEFL